MEEKIKKTRAKKEEAPKESIRDSRGLVKGVDYVFDANGFVDWRAMVNPKFVVLNKQSAARKGVDIKTITEDEKAKYLAEWGDESKLILLAGFRELLKLRGATNVSYTVERSDGVVIASCYISFKPNYETGMECYGYSGVASASRSNVDGAYAEALEAIACNRAFCRTVREALNIYVVAEEEVNPLEEVKINSPIKALKALEEKCRDKGIGFDSVLTFLEGMGHTNPEWVSFASLPPSVAFDAMQFAASHG